MGKKINSSWAQEMDYGDIMNELDEYEDIIDGAYHAIHTMNIKDNKERKIKKFPKNVW